MASVRGSTDYLAAKSRRPSSVGPSTFGRRQRGGKMLVPDQAKETFQALLKGLDGLSLRTQDELQDLKEGRDVFVDADRNHELNVQEIKACEQYLRRIDSVKVRVMKLQERYNHAVTPSNENGNMLDTMSKKQFKDILAVLDQLEREMEGVMGSFSIAVQEIAGFARLCSGDHFELSVKYGTQRWKTRAKIGSDRSQTWIPSDSVQFKCLNGDPLQIRVSEVKLFTSNALCEKQFRTTAFFSAEPQLMSLQLNRSGSLKLILVISWDPFGRSSAPRRSLEHTFNTVSYNTAPSAPRHRPSRPLSAFYDSMTSDSQFALQPTPSTASTGSDSGCSTGSTPATPPSPFRNTKSRMRALLSTLDTFNYAECSGLQHSIALCYDGIKALEDQWSRGPTHELNQHVKRGLSTYSKGNQRSHASIEASDPVWQEVERCMNHHLSHCESLAKTLKTKFDRQNLSDALYKMEIEAVNIASISELTVPQNHAFCVVKAFGARVDLVKLWLSSCQSQPPLMVEASALRGTVATMYASGLKDLKEPVLSRVMSLVQDGGAYSAEQVSLFQLGAYFREKDIATFVESLAHEVWIIRELNASESARSRQVIEKLRRVPVPPPPECLKQMALILRHKDINVARGAEHYFASAKGELRDDLVSIVMALLDSHEDSAQVGACEALALMKAKRSIGPIAALYSRNKSDAVTHAAKVALLSFGVEGAEALQRADHSALVERL